MPERVYVDYRPLGSIKNKKKGMLFMLQHAEKELA